MATIYSLVSLADHALGSQLKAIATQHREVTARLLAHLAEFDARRLFRAAGYASMHAYCVGELRFSEDAAYKRIQVARAAREFPVMFDMLADGRLHVSGALLLAPRLTVANGWELLQAASGRTKSGNEMLLAERFPQPDVATLLQPVSAAVNVSCQLAPGRVGMTSGEQVASVTSSTATREVVAASPVLPTVRAAFPRLTPLAPERFALQVTLSRETRDKLRRAQELLGHALPDGDIAQVLDRALDVLISKLESRKCGETSNPRPRRGHAKGRHVASELKRQVYARDGHQCAFVSEAGKRCDARSSLELDHVIPLARGGRTELANLRLLCRVHNQLQAERVLGRGFMEAKRGEGSVHRTGRSTGSVSPHGR